MSQGGEPQSIGWGDVAFAAAVAGTLSGAPSTAWALVRGRSVLESTRAAGTLIPGRRHRPSLVAGAAVHVVISTFWTAVLAAAAARRPIRMAGAAGAGLAIAAVDLGVIGRRYPAIRALPTVPQWLDHAAFGAVVATTLRIRARPPSRMLGQTWPPTLIFDPTFTELACCAPQSCTR